MPEEESHKTCTKCGESKALSDYYFEKGKPRSKCKVCHTKKVYERSPERIREINAIDLYGPDIRANVQLMCQPCNRSKWATLEGQIHFGC